MTTSEIFYPARKLSAHNFAMGVFWFAVLWLAATFKVPWAPVPLSMQLLAALMCGFMLDWRTAAWTGVAYAAAALVKYSPLAAGNTEFTGGYVVGFAVAATFVAALWPRVAATPPAMRFGATLLLALSGAVIVHVLGFVQLHHALLQHNAEQTIAMTLAVGAWPFVVPDLVKCVIAAVAAIALPERR